MEDITYVSEMQTIRIADAGEGLATAEPRRSRTNLYIVWAANCRGEVRIW